MVADDIEIPEAPEPPPVPISTGKRSHHKQPPKRGGTRIGSAPGSASTGEGPNAAAGTNKQEMTGTFYGIFTFLASITGSGVTWEEREFAPMAGGFMVIAKSFPAVIVRLLPILKPVLFATEAAKKLNQIRQGVLRKRQEQAAQEAQTIVGNPYVEQAQGGYDPNIGTPHL